MDVNVHDTTSLDLASSLKERRIPVLFLTGYDVPDLTGEWRDHAVCRKPCDALELERLLIGVLAAKRRPDAGM
jgi:hypothetical protein